jgi:hypothetical protein
MQICYKLLQQMKRWQLRSPQKIEGIFSWF